MHTKGLKGWLKHGDFILVDILCLQLCFCISYWMNEGYSNPYATDRFQYLALVLIVCQLLSILFSNNYTGILRRGIVSEFFAVLRIIFTIIVLMIVYLFALHQSLLASRMHIAVTAGLFIILDTLLRLLNKWRIIRFRKYQSKRSIVLITSKDLFEEALLKLREPSINEFIVSKVLLMDEMPASASNIDVPVSLMNEESIMDLSHEWVDEVFILQPDNMPFPEDVANALSMMGITIHFTISALIDDRWSITEINKLGGYKVLTSSIHTVNPGQMFIKRMTDIIGGIIGCIFTGIVLLFIAPIIYLKSPGPIFFSQNRIGKNGKVFRMYKFRSMYMDAEARKAELMEKNKIQSGLMFKMDDDPRIIGSERKGKDGKPKGIGNFIRNTSIDELPQFFNILKNDMSLVGTRPPTIDEWEKYDLAHRVRMSIKPGLTGMWQVSGRSEITDFEEVVRLDREYIENWSLLLDIKILLKTVLVVFTHKGAE